MRRDGELPPFLAILSYDGKLVITADAKLQDWCRDALAGKMSAEWGFDIGRLVMIDTKLREYGYHLEKARMYLVPSSLAQTPDERVRALNAAEIAAMAEDERIDEAFLFSDADTDDPQDRLGTALYDETGRLCAVAGASDNGSYLWEIGVNAFEGGHGYGTTVVRELARQVAAPGKVPYYDTAMSHLASLNVALKSGMTPAFCELRAARNDA